MPSIQQGAAQSAEQNAGSDEQDTESPGIYMACYYQTGHLGIACYDTTLAEVSAVLPKTTLFCKRLSLLELETSFSQMIAGCQCPRF